MSSNNPQELAALFEKIAQLLELQGENPFKVRAYLRAARSLEQLREPLELLIREERLGSIEGIGKNIEEKIKEFSLTGRLLIYDELNAQFPPSLLELFEIQGLGAKKIRLLYQKLQICSLEDLEKACLHSQIAMLPGFGPKSAENIEQGILFYKKNLGKFRLDQVLSLAKKIVPTLEASPDVLRCQIAGSLRRWKETIGDLDLIVSSRNPTAVMALFLEHALVAEVLMKGATKSSVRLKNDLGESMLQCDLRVVKPEEFPFALLYFTGSREHNIRLRSRALEFGWSLNEYSLSAQEGAPPPPLIEEEEDIYHALKLDFIAPELREDRGEVSAAALRELPELLEWPQLCGTFHCHTRASDGKNTIVEMAEAAQELGLDYLGIADHSKSSLQAHGLSEERLFEQIEEIRIFNQSSRGIHLFAGIECDILKDGRLDFSDAILSKLDYVVASVHSSFQLDECTMTNRILRAMENPYITMIGHLSGRLLFSREPYALNIPTILDAAAATKTWIELNASPYRLDLDWRWWSLAKEKGVRCVINPDAHHTSGFQHLRLGVHSARKGGLRREEVINTLPLEKIGEALKLKRTMITSS